MTRKLSRAKTINHAATELARIAEISKPAEKIARELMLYIIDDLYDTQDVLTNRFEDWCDLFEGQENTVPN